MIRRVAAVLVPVAFLALLGTAPGARTPAGPDNWADWRGPGRDGVSAATGLPDSWSPEGDNVAWAAPFGGRSAPVVYGNRLYLQNAAGEGAQMQERVMALDADTGAVVWEHRFNVKLSDVPPHRVGWSSPAVDTDTGNVYAMGVDGTLMGLSPDGETLWEHFLPESFGILSTHGGRTVSPIIEGANVIASGVMSSWGALAPGRHRFLALDKISGQIVWVSTPSGPPYDTTYAHPIVRDLGGQRLLIQGVGDGAVHAIKVATGEPVWSYPISKRGINSAVVVDGDVAIVTHGEENIADHRMGMVAAIDATGTGVVTPDRVRWATMSLLAGYSSPVLAGGVVYEIDNSANLLAIDVGTGEVRWSHNIGTIQRASPVFADGKLYVGTVNGTFWILRPGADGVEVLDEDELSGDDGIDEIVASVAVARGRVYLVTSSHVYAIGPKDATVELDRRPGPAPMASDEPVAAVTVYPQELVLAPGDSVSFEARLFDAHGNAIGTRRDGLEWQVAGIAGEIDGSGTLTVSGAAPAGGAVTVNVDGVAGSARVRVFPPLPWQIDFDDMAAIPPYWVGALGKFRPEQQDGNGVFVKLNDNPFFKRTKVFIGGSDLADYTVQVDFKSALERRHLGDAGVIAQRYALILYGTKQALELQPWAPEIERTVTVPFPARPDTWYRMKLRTQNLGDGVLIQGKLWARDEPEPAEWTIETTDPAGNRQGSPGLYADAHAVVTFDNLIVEPNQ